MNNKFNLFSIAFFASSQIFAPSLTGLDALRDPVAVASVNIRNLNLRNECLSRRNLLMPSLQPGSTPAPEQFPEQEIIRRGMHAELNSTLRTLALQSNGCIDLNILERALSRLVLTDFQDVNSSTIYELEYLQDGVFKKVCIRTYYNNIAWQHSDLKSIDFNCWRNLSSRQDILDNDSVQKSAFNNFLATIC